MRVNIISFLKISVFAKRGIPIQTPSQLLKGNKKINK